MGTKSGSEDGLCRIPAAPRVETWVRADTAMAHVVKDDRVRVGSRVEAVWAPDEARTGSIRDIACFRVMS